MKVIIVNRNKLDIFVALFQLLKNWSSHITMMFLSDGLHIQSMDKSHICLTKILIKKEWFFEYNYTEDTKISVDTSHFYSIINYGSEHEQIHLESNDGETDKLFINFINTNKDTDKNKDKKIYYDHFFEITLIDVEDDILNIPKVDYDVELTIETKKINDLFSELETFGSTVNIYCTEEVLELNASDDRSKLKISVDLDDLQEFSILEGGKIDITYSLLHLHKMSISQKLSKMVNISISEKYPLMINYDLGHESIATFYIAPKI